MAITGALIVMCGLAVLSFLISQLHKIIALFEKKHSKPVLEEKEEKKDPADKAGLFILDDLAATARIYQGISSQLGPKFNLIELYQLLNKEALPHPHITIRSLRDAGYLAPAGEGLFCWKTE